jgi:hypothetical protein
MADDRPSTLPLEGEPVRYCRRCGDAFASEGADCESCGARWTPPAPFTIAELSTVLEDLSQIRRDGTIGPRCHSALQDTYVRRIAALRSARTAAVQPAPVLPWKAPPPAERRRPVAEDALRPPSEGVLGGVRQSFQRLLDPIDEQNVDADSEPRPALTAPDHTARPVPRASIGQRPSAAPRKPVGAALAEWSAARQADILLYLGAFLLSIAALIFVGYQGEALSGPARFAILMAYTASFLTLGFVLPRWERVREAGAVFLGLGAILVPINFIALRTQVLDDSMVPTDVILVGGASATAVLYIALAVRGFGRLYALPGSVAAVVAWGALGSVLNLPVAWFGAWFVGGAAATYTVTLFVRVPAERWIARGACAIGAAGLIVAQMTALSGEGDTAQLPTAYALATAAAAVAAVVRRTVPVLALLPALAALTGATAWWSAFGLEREWYGSFAAAAALGYLLVATLDNAARTRAWLHAAALLAGGSLLAVHMYMLEPAASHAALPATYALVLLGAVGATARWRRPEILAVVPPLVAGLGASTLWVAWSMPLVWLGPWIAVAALGYLVIAARDEASRAFRWRVTAAAVAAGALVITHRSVAGVGADPLALPAAYTLVLLGVVAAYVRWRERAALSTIPALMAATGASVLWALWAIPLEWLGAWAAAAALGYLAIAEADEARRSDWRLMALVVGAGALTWAHAAAVLEQTNRAQLPLTYAILLLGAAWDGIRRRDVALGLLPPLAVGFGASLAWAARDMRLDWLGCWIALAAPAYLAVAEADAVRRLQWRRLAAVAGVLALVWAHAAAWEGAIPNAELPLVYGILLAASLWDAIRRRDAGMGVVPPLAGGLGATAAWAFASMPLAWLGPWVAGVGLGYLVTAEIERGHTLAWRGFAGTAGLYALVFAHVAAAIEPDRAFQLPATYSLVLLGTVFDSVRRRDQGMIALPAIGVLWASSLLWALGIEPLWWIYPALIAAAALVATEPWWRDRPSLRTPAWLYILLFAGALPVLWLGEFADEAAHGLAAFAAAAAILFIAAPRARGRQAGRLQDSDVVLAAAASYTGAALGFLNALLDVSGSDRAWLFAAYGAVAWTTPLFVGQARRERFNVNSGTAFAATVVAFILAATDPRTATLVLGIGAAGPIVAFAATRRWFLLPLAAGIAALAAGYAWAWQHLHWAELPLLYAAAGAVLAATLAAHRRYSRDERGLAITTLSWGPWALAAAVAYTVLLDAQSGLAAGEALVRTQEWAVMVLVTGSAAVAIILEGVRLHLRTVWLPGTSGVMAAVLCGIAILQPTNVQAYTLPLGFYLVAVGLCLRSAPSFLGAHMSVGEAVTVAGMLAIVLPPAAQSFEPGGGIYGLELIAYGLLFLAVGLVLASRWLVAGGVLTLTGVAVRWLLVYGSRAPYWLTLGIVGTLLLGLGLLLLFERDWWQRSRARLVDWWRREDHRDTPKQPPSAASPGANTVR